MFKKPKSTPAAEPFQVPTLSDVSPDYAALVAKRTELQGRRSVLDKEYQGLRRGKASPASVEAAGRERNARVSELLGDLGNGGYRVPAANIEVNDRLEEVRAELSAVDGALAIIEARLPGVVQDASELVCEAARPNYCDAIRRCALALAPAIEAHREIRRLTSDLEDTDARWRAYLSQPESLLRFLGERWENDSPAHKFISGAIATGIVTAAEIEEAKNG